MDDLIKIDLQALISEVARSETERDGHVEQRRLIDIFRDCLCNDGFVVLQNLNMTDIQSTSTVKEPIIGFFELPIDEKMKAVSMDKARRGYSPAQTENFASLIGVGNKSNDTVEKFRVGPLISELEKQQNEGYYSGKEGRLHYFPNTWPEHPDQFVVSTSKLYNSMLQLSYSITSLIEIATAIPIGSLAKNFAKHTSIMSLNYYPTDTLQISEEKIELVAEHTDVSFFTIVLELMEGCSHRGYDSFLEVRDRFGCWRKVDLQNGECVVNVGDCLAAWSSSAGDNGMHSALHRVVAKRTCDGGDHVTQKSEVTSSTSELETSNFSHDFDLAIAGDGGALRSEPPRRNRCSAVFFHAPAYDAQMIWPSVEGDGLNYNQWRKQKIQSAMKSLKQSSTRK